MSRWCLLAAALGLLAAPAWAQPARLHVLTDSVTVGERFGVAVAVEHGPAVQALFPEPPPGEAAVTSPLRAGEAELLAVRRFPPQVRGSTRIDSVVYEAAAFALDSARVGPVTVRLVRGGDTTAVTTPVGWVGVRSLVPEDATEPKDLLPLADFPRPLWPWALAALLALLLLALVLWWRRRRRAAPVLAPHEEVTQRLDVLAASTLGPDAKPYYVELSDALRTYLARTLGVPAREQTTAELLADLGRRPAEVPEAARDDLAYVLRLSDLVKFAGFRPDDGTHQRAVELARVAVGVIEAEREEERVEGG